MAITFKEWLKLKFDRVLTVQTTSLQSDFADLVLHLWSGGRIRIHMLDQATSVRTLKKMLSDGTSVGVNVLFLVDVRLLPPDGSRADIKEWLVALHTLCNDRVYAYRVTSSGPEIIQVHFEAILHSTELRIWYGPKVDFASLRYFRKSVALRSIRGDWLIADFNAPAFWKNTDYRAARAQAERAQHTNTHWHDWSTFQTWSGVYEGTENADEEATHAKRNGRASLGDYLTECYALLGVEKGSSAEEVKKAFRKRAILYHPDTSELPVEEATAKFKALNAAYDYIKSANGWT